jgi:hypothetical protein
VLGAVVLDPAETRAKLEKKEFEADWSTVGGLEVSVVEKCW